MATNESEGCARASNIALRHQRLFKPSRDQPGGRRGHIPSAAAGPAPALRSAEQGERSPPTGAGGAAADGYPPIALFLSYVKRPSRCILLSLLWPFGAPLISAPITFAPHCNDLAACP